MSRQLETVLISSPMISLLKNRGWECFKTHGSQYQEGFPDYYIIHTLYSPRWIEFKRKDEYNLVHLTDAQKIVFPKFIICKVPLYIIADIDLRKDYSRRLYHYNKLFEEPNGYMVLSSQTMRLL